MAHFILLDLLPVKSSINSCKTAFSGFPTWLFREAIPFEKETSKHFSGYIVWTIQMY
ncbi:MAG: hypothetical protein Q4A57_06460 [Porphyromonas circumdentaria]|nr:hypothetical protein [Porphyromonas circumdentaria]